MERRLPSPVGGWVSALALGGAVRYNLRLIQDVIMREVGTQGQGGTCHFEN
jgi:hypothetical protein